MHVPLAAIPIVLSAQAAGLTGFSLHLLALPIGNMHAKLLLWPYKAFVRAEARIEGQLSAIALASSCFIPGRKKMNYKHGDKRTHTPLYRRWERET